MVPSPSSKYLRVIENHLIGKFHRHHMTKVGHHMQSKSNYIYFKTHVNKTPVAAY